MANACPEKKSDLYSFKSNLFMKRNCQSAVCRTCEFGPSRCVMGAQNAVYLFRVATGQGKVREIQGQGKVREFWNWSGKFDFLMSYAQ